MPYSIQNSSTETSHKETIIPIQTDNKTYLENKQSESNTTTEIVNSDQNSEGIVQTPIPKKCALDFFKNIIKENESEQNFLKETEKPLPPNFHSDTSRKETHHHVESQYQPGVTSPVFPHTDDQIPTEFSKNILSERVESKSQTWKPVSPVPQPFQNPYPETPLYLEPGPPPEICYTPNVAPPPKENFTERIKKMEAYHQATSVADAPQGGIKIFPKKEPSPAYKPPEPVVQPYKPTQEYRPMVEEQVRRTKEVSYRETSLPSHGPVLRPQADVNVRPTSPRPSAEGVSMEKLWTTKLHKESEVTHPASPVARPFSPKPNVVSELRESSSHTEIKRSASPRPSAEGVKMDKMWAHATNQSQHTPHPTSLMPEGIPPPAKKDAEDEEAKRLAWSRKYLEEGETSSRTVKTVTQHNSPTPAPAYNPPISKPPTTQFTPKPAYVAAPPPPYKAPTPVHHVSPPREQPRIQSSFDQSSSYKQSSYQSNQKTNAPWVKSDSSQNVVTPPWVKPSPPPTPSHSSMSQNFSSEDRSFSSTTQQRPAQFNGYSKPNTYAPFQPKLSENQYYKVESHENESRQFNTPTFSPYSSQNSNQSNSNMVQQSFSSQTMKESSYQSGGSFSNVQQAPTSFSESSVVEEHHLKPSLAKKVWPLVQNSSSSYTPVVPNLTSAPVTETFHSYERSNTDNGFIEKEIKTQKSFQTTEKKFSYPPPCRSSLQSKIAAFEEKSYQSDYDSKFDSSDSEIRRTGSLKRPQRPSSASSAYGTLPKTFGRSNSFSNANYETSQQRYTEEIIPGLKPGSPPQILHASQFYGNQKRNGYNQGDSGYMADTEDFQSKLSQDGSSYVTTTNKKVRPCVFA